MNWYTSWGGALDGSWAWQIGASHCHEFYQNPLAAYALVNDSALNAGMKAQGATEDFEASLSRQMELYLWLMSKDGPIAGGCTAPGTVVMSSIRPVRLLSMIWLIWNILYTLTRVPTTGSVTRYGLYSVWLNCIML